MKPLPPKKSNGKIMQEIQADMDKKQITFGRKMLDLIVRVFNMK